MSEIRIAVAGVGNCTNSLVQGRFYYRELGIKNEELKMGEVIPGWDSGKGR